jgi:hypothetical protein
MEEKIAWLFIEMFPLCSKLYKIYQHFFLNKKIIDWIYSSYELFMKRKSLTSDGQQFHQYQQKSTNTSQLKPLNTNRTTTYIYTSQQKKRYKYFFFRYIFMLKPKQLLIIIYVNVCVKRVYPHKANNNILFALRKLQKVNLQSHDGVCDDRIRHLNHLRSLIVQSTKVNNLPF